MTLRVSFLLDRPSNVVQWRSPGSKFFPTLPRFTTIRTVSHRPITSRHHWTAFSSGPVAAASDNPPENLGNGQTQEDGSNANAEKNDTVLDTIRGWWRRIQNPELRQKLVSLGPAAVLAYGELCIISSLACTSTTLDRIEFHCEALVRQLSALKF